MSFTNINPHKNPGGEGTVLLLTTFHNVRHGGLAG